MAKLITKSLVVSEEILIFNVHTVGKYVKRTNQAFFLDYVCTTKLRSMMIIKLEVEKISERR